MVMAAVTVVYVNTPETQEMGAKALADAYNVIHADGTESNALRLWESLVNGFVMVLFICAITFVIVLLYKYRCMKFLIGYMMLSIMLLLGLMSSVIFQVAIEKYRLPVDVPTFWLLLYNFAMTGVTSIFFGENLTPTWVTQGTLISMSVIVAWQLSHFDSWTAWVLLVLLALYDLFAVLTPCGPLKALVSLMSQDDAPDMPGLLYEASLPNRSNSLLEGRQPDNKRRSSSTTVTTTTTESTSGTPSVSMNTADGVDGHSNQTNTFVSNDYGSTDDAVGAQLPNNEERVRLIDEEQPVRPSNDTVPTPPEGTRKTRPSVSSEQPQRVIGRIPLAIARLYRLPLVETGEPVSRESSSGFSPRELQSSVDVHFPASGGKIALHSKQHPGQPTRYVVLDRDGNQKHVLFINDEGRVFECRQGHVQDEDSISERNSIRLGLGDFIFYSILVSKAALYSYTTFVACTCAIVAGLGLTLLLLAVYGHALPALPVSIFLGVIFYLLTRYTLEPWAEHVLTNNAYV